jgi:hypothetical protein
MGGFAGERIADAEPLTPKCNLKDLSIEQSLQKVRSFFILTFGTNRKTSDSKDMAVVAGKSSNPKAVPN